MEKKWKLSYFIERESYEMGSYLLKGTNNVSRGTIEEEVKRDRRRIQLIDKISRNTNTHVITKRKVGDRTKWRQHLDLPVDRALMMT